MSLRRRLGSDWAQTWKLGRHWRLNVEWNPKAASFDFWVYDSRREYHPGPSGGEA